MKKRVFLVAAMGLVATLVAGGLVASNMGFKLNYQLAAPGTSGSATGQNALSMPFNQQTNITNAAALLADIDAVAGSSVADTVSRLLKADNTLQSYTGLAGVNFPITPGEGYFVIVSGDVDYIVVGSHNPSLGINLDAAGTVTPEGPSASGNNVIAYPYHSTATNAFGLIAEIDAHAGASAVDSVSRLVIQDNTLETYTGLAGVNFLLTPGEAYYVAVTQDVVGWVPNHY